MATGTEDTKWCQLSVTLALLCAVKGTKHVSPHTHTHKHTLLKGLKCATLLIGSGFDWEFSLREVKRGDKDELQSWDTHTVNRWIAEFSQCQISCSVTSHSLSLVFKLPAGKTSLRGCASYFEVAIITADDVITWMCVWVCSHLLNIHAPSPGLVLSQWDQTSCYNAGRQTKRRNTVSVFCFFLASHCCLVTRQLHRWNVVICMTLGAAPLISFLWC